MLYLGGITPVAHEDTLSGDTSDRIHGLFCPDGYFELKGIGRTLAEKDLTWMNGRVLKIVTPYIRHLPAHRPELKFKAIFMERDINEIIASLMVMRTVYEENPGESVKYGIDFLRLWNIPTHVVKYRDLVQYPKSVAIGVADFLECDMDIDKMAMAINKDPRKGINKYIKENKSRIITFINGKTDEIFVDKVPKKEDLKVCSQE